MNISTIAFILIAVFGVALLVLLVGGLLVRSDVHRATLLSTGPMYARSRVLEDLRPVQDFVVDFVAQSSPSSQLLDFLGEQAQAVSIIELRAKLPFRAERLWTAVFITSVTGLIRIGRDGMAITEAGRVVRARLNDVTFAERAAAAPAQREQPATRDGVASVATWSKLETGTPRVEVGQLREPGAVPSDSPQTGSGPATSTARRVSISAADHHELSAAIAASRKLAVLARETRPLQDKLMKATLTRASEIPHDLITMNSRAEVVDLGTNERIDLLLVYPADHNIAEGRISVFHPLGAAMLGHRVGDEFEWPVPYGTRRYRVAAVGFQPEAAFAMAA